MPRSVWGIGRRAVARAVLALFIGALVVLSAAPVLADDTVEARQLVEKAEMMLERFAKDPEMGGFRDVIKTAKAVLLIPQVLRAGFIFGGSGGTGLLLARHQETGTWRGPVFYTLGNVSFGLQIGLDASEVAILAHTEKGLKQMFSDTVKLGADASVAAGPVGVGAQAATAALSADLVAFTRAQGLYAGLSVDGGLISVREKMTTAYYGMPAKPVDILVHGTLTNPQAAALLRTVERVAKGE